MKYKHNFEVYTFGYKNSTIGHSILSVFNYLVYKKCKYCSFSCRGSDDENSCPTCISDDEKAIKDILE